MKNLLLTLLGVIFIGFCIYLFLGKPANSNFKPLMIRQTEVKIGEILVNVDISNTEKSREQGLSGRLSIGTNEGMLFIFEKPGKYGFWMKDMNFPIDIIGLDQNKEVVWEEKGLLPSTYPQIFSPETSILYVLELPMGFIDEHHVDMGSVVSFEL